MRRKKTLAIFANMEVITLTTQQAISLTALPSKQMQLLLICLLVSNEAGKFDEIRLFAATNALELKASRVAGNLRALAKRRLIISLENDLLEWVINPKAVSISMEFDNMFEAIEKTLATIKLNRVIDEHEETKRRSSKGNKQHP